MGNTWLQIIFGVATLYFGVQTWRLLPTFLRLVAALLSGAVKWPGPRVHDPDPSASKVRERLGVGYQNLFSTFIGNTLGLIAALGFSLLNFLIGTPLLSGSIRIEWKWDLVCVYLFVFAGGWLALQKALVNMVRVNTILSDLKNKGEPRAVGGWSAEAEYAIEHPLIGRKAASSANTRALDQFYESTRCHQDGEEWRALALYQEALSLDPSLHQHAIDTLSGMAQACSAKEAGAIHYWLGIHAEYLCNWKLAATWYEKAILSFAQLNYSKRESRAHCNLGNVKMHMRDETAMDEFEKAIALNPKNGTAYLNIGRIYYGISREGDYRFERALEAFAGAILADPLTYGPRVIASLREIGYTWQEDLEKIMQRVERRKR